MYQYIIYFFDKLKNIKFNLLLLKFILQLFMIFSKKKPKLFQIVAKKYICLNNLTLNLQILF